MRLLSLIAASVALTAAEPPAPAPDAVPTPPAVTAGAVATSVRAVFLRSLANAPAVHAAQERILASRRAAGAAGRLPDPMLSGGYARKTTTMDRWPMYEAMLEQPLPRWGERDAMRAKAAAECIALGYTGTPLTLTPIVPRRSTS